MNDPQSLIRRAERIAPPPDPIVAGKTSSSVHAPYGPRVFGVIDHITLDFPVIPEVPDPDGGPPLRPAVLRDVIFWQRVSYKDRRLPQAGKPGIPESPTHPIETPGIEARYRRFGPIERGFPKVGMVVGDYEGAKWGSGGITRDTQVVWATFLNGNWIIELADVGSFKPVIIIDSMPTANPFSSFLLVRPAKIVRGGVHDGEWNVDPTVNATDDQKIVETWFNHEASHYLPMVGLTPPLVAAMVMVNGSARLLPNGANMRFS